MHRIVPRALLAASLAVTAAVSMVPTAEQGARAATSDSTFFATVDVDPGATVGAPAAGDNASHGDLWPNCWSDDDEVYTAYGDGIGFGGPDNGSDIGVAKISGMPGQLAGTQLAKGDDVGRVWSSPDGYTRKPTAWRASAARSTSPCRTWRRTSTTPPRRRSSSRRTTAGHGRPTGPRRCSTTASSPPSCSSTTARRTSTGPTVTSTRTGSTATGATRSTTPSPTPPTSTWRGYRRTRCSTGRPGSSRTASTRRASPPGRPTSARRSRCCTTTGASTRTSTPTAGSRTSASSARAASSPSKYISADGRSMWLQANVCPCGGGYPQDDNWAYTFSLRKLRLEPFAPSTPSNGPDDARNLAKEPGTVPIERAGHFGTPAYYSDGNKQQHEDDWNDENKSASWWGYTWPRQYTVNEVAYTTGTMFGDGGWFSADLRVQVRRDHAWVDVDGLRVDPAYPNDETAGANRTYRFSFDAVAADGVRIIGTPGGTRTFTSIAELEAYYGTGS